MWKNRDGINDHHFSQLFLLLGEGGIGESHAVEKVVLSTLHSNWLLSLPLYTTGYAKQGGDSRTWNFHRTPPDVIHTLEADETMSQTNRTI